MQVPEDLKIVCPLCGGKGTNTVGGFADHAKEHQISCRMCKGRQWLWALDQEEMAQRIAKVEAENAVLKKELEQCQEALGDATT